MGRGGFTQAGSTPRHPYSTSIFWRQAFHHWRIPDADVDGNAVPWRDSKKIYSSGWLYVAQSFPPSWFFFPGEGRDMMHKNSAQWIHLTTPWLYVIIESFDLIEYYHNLNGLKNVCLLSSVKRFNFFKIKTFVTDDNGGQYCLFAETDGWKNHQTTAKLRKEPSLEQK